MSLYLNNQKIKGSGLKLSATLPIAGSDVSGQSSLAATSETGNKAKIVNVKLNIKYVNHPDLTDLIILAEDKTNKGARETYSIKNDTASALRIRRVRFKGDLNVNEDDSLQLWQVSFKLIEVLSVPEAVGKRVENQAVTDQSPVDSSVAKSGDETESFTGMERLLKAIEDYLSKDEP